MVFIPTYFDPRLIFFLCRGNRGEAIKPPFGSTRVVLSHGQREFYGNVCCGPVKHFSFMVLKTKH